MGCFAIWKFDFFFLSFWTEKKDIDVPADIPEDEEYDEEGRLRLFLICLNHFQIWQHINSLA